MIVQCHKTNLKYIPRSIWRGCSMSTSCQALPSAQVKITNSLDINTCLCLLVLKGDPTSCYHRALCRSCLVRTLALTKNLFKDLFPCFFHFVLFAEVVLRGHLPRWAARGDGEEGAWEEEVRAACRCYCYYHHHFRFNRRFNFIISMIRNEERRQQALLSVRSGASRVLGLAPILLLLPCLF